VSRRAFLKATGFAFVGEALSGCARGPLPRAPVEHAIPFLNQPEEINPGRAYLYASTCAGCSAGCGLLVKNRDGRPIKLEGNPEHSLSRGGLCAVGQASILGLYDRLRLQHPTIQGKEATWEEADREILRQLEQIHRRGGAVRVLTGTVTSPTLRALIQKFLTRFPDGKHIIHEPLSCSAILEAHQQTHGVRVLPHYRFERAEIIVAFDADFLGTWISPVEFTAGYRAGRTLEGTPPRLSYHVQVESRLSLSGAKADQRLCIAPTEVGLVMTHLAARLAPRAGIEFSMGSIEPSPVGPDVLDQLAERLWQARGRSLIVCGSQDITNQVLCNFLNHVLGSYGTTVDLAHPSYQKQEASGQMETLLQDVQGGRVAALFVLDSNPLFDLPDSEHLAAAFGRVPLLVDCAERLDETTAVAHIVCPIPHFLACWSDAEPVSGVVSLAQPTMHSPGDTRPILESIAAWMGTPRSAYALLQEHWQRHVFPRASGARDFQTFWDRTLHDGHGMVRSTATLVRPFTLNAVQPVLQAEQPEDGKPALVFYAKIGMPDGRHAYNPWLHELPDPITKATWDNYACLSPTAAARLDVTDGDVVRLETAGRPSVELPVLLQPGQHDKVVAVALGYGSRMSARFAGVGPEWLEARPTVGQNGLAGTNAAPLLAWANGDLQASGNVQVIKMERQHPLALTQTHHTITVPGRLAQPGLQRRPCIQEMTPASLARHKAEGERHPAHEEDLWPADHPETGPRWGMVIDLNACSGCSACVIACQVENNIPVVGKDEVRREREMHWLRLDRYYSGEGEAVDVFHQPMLCHHCGNAPCETVCPVLATVHSAEGLNQQVYNRCVGTRYCANNCPYKVRRFNWFDYPHADALQNLVLNPDVTVRSRGVMEKCTFCVQRIQEAKIEARRQGLEVRDGDIRTACQQSCPAQAIIFGDLNDARSKAAKLQANPRRYQVLAELNVKPSVSYLAVVRNRPGQEGRERRE
jgi:molybdopterin-containing oxidoreductase family iron-sulfur binding subunit